MLSSAMSYVGSTSTQLVGILSNPSYANGGAMTALGRWTSIRASGTFGGGTQNYNGTNDAVGVWIDPTFNVGTGSTGTFTALNVNPTITQGGSGVTNYLAKFGTTGGGLKLSIDTSGNVLQQGNLTLGTAGNGILIKEGTNATMGTCTLVLGTCTVSTTKVTANSRIFLTAQSLGTVSVGQGLAVSARSAGTSFTVLSGSGVDTSVVAWEIIEPAP